MSYVLHLFVHIPPGVFFIWGHVRSFVHGSLLCIHICVTTAVRMYVYIYNMVITCSKGKNQQGKVANPAPGQLAEQGKIIFPCPRSRLRVWSRETGSAVPSRVSLLISILRLNLVLTYGIPPWFRDGVHLLSVHIIYHECCSTYMYILCTATSAASLFPCSVSSTNECPHIK